MESNPAFDLKSKQLIQDFLKDALKICDKNKSDLLRSDDLYPELDDGEYRRIITKSISHYDYFVETIISEKLEKLNSFQLLNLSLSEQPIKEYYQGFFNQKHIPIPNDLQELTKIIPKNILINYLSHQDSFEFSENSFNLIFREFNFFMKNPKSDEYVLPLYNFESNLKNDSLKFGNITLRAITEYELKTISKLNEKNEISDLNKKLSYVLTIFLDSDNLSSGFEIAKNEFTYFLYALILNFPGILQIGTIYQNINFSWKSFEIGPKLNLNESFFPLYFDKTDYNSLNSFYHLLKKSNLENESNEFLKMSINRFQIGLNRERVIDKIVDFCTSLESLYASGPGDITRKLSQRCCMVISINEDEHEYYHDFIKKAYNFRSGLVHGEGNRKLNFDGKQLSVDEVSNILETVNRNSIKKFLKLIKFYSTKEKNKEIIQDIDSSLVNRKNYLLFKKRL